jgi:hypothetical protein
VLFPDLKSHAAQQNGHPVTAGIPTQMRGNVWQLSVAMMVLGDLMKQQGTRMLGGIFIELLN